MKSPFKERKLLRNQTWKTKGIWWGISKFLLYFTTAILLFLSFSFPLPFFPVLPLPTFHGPGSLGILFDFFVLLLAPLHQAEGGNTALKACEDTW